MGGKPVKSSFINLRQEGLHANKVIAMAIFVHISYIHCLYVYLQDDDPIVDVFDDTDHDQSTCP